MATKPTETDTATGNMQRQATGQEGLTTQSADMNRRSFWQTVAALVTGAVTGNSASSPKANAGTIAITNAAEGLTTSSTAMTRRTALETGAAILTGAFTGNSASNPSDGRTFDITQPPTVTTLRGVSLGSKWIAPDGLQFKFMTIDEIREGRVVLNLLSTTHFAAAAVAAAVKQGQLATEDKVAISFKKNGTEFVVSAAELLKVWQADDIRQIHRVIAQNRYLYRANLEMMNTASAAGVKATGYIKTDGTNITVTDINPPINLRFIRTPKETKE